MRVQIGIEGVKLAQARLAAIEKSIDPILRGSLNTTVRWARRGIFAKELRKVFPQRSWLNKKLKLKLAGTRRLNARIIPSSSGVEVRTRRGWGYREVSRTRGRIYVPDIDGGPKLAAGFVNPASRKKEPLSTRSARARNLKKPPKHGQRKSYRYDYHQPRPALGPSVAYYFKRLSNVRRVRMINSYAQQDFEKRVREAELKAAAKR
ncbi:hypothetical protein D9M69_337390 [compost metagenome]